MYGIKLDAAKITLNRKSVGDLAFGMAKDYFKQGAKAFVEEGAKRVPVETGFSRGVFNAKISTLEGTQSTPQSYLGAKVKIDEGKQLRTRLGRFGRKRKSRENFTRWKNHIAGANTSSYKMYRKGTKYTFEINVSGQHPYFQYNDYVRGMITNPKPGYTYPWDSMLTGLDAFNNRLKRKIRQKVAIKKSFTTEGTLYFYDKEKGQLSQLMRVENIEVK